LKYAQVCKKREKEGVVGMVKRVVFGNLEKIWAILGADSNGNIGCGTKLASTLHCVRL
jgi:hypothetical protein